MKKKVILLLLILVISAVFFIPVSQQKTISVKSSFLKVYRQLSGAESWEKWRPDLNKNILTDSNKVSIKKDTNSFIIKYADLELNVKWAGNSFNIMENSDNRTINYGYAIIPDTVANKTFITVSKKSNVLNYLVGKFKPASFSETHIADFKNFMETDSLYYGCKVFKTKIPGSYLIVITKEVLSKDKFDEAAKSEHTLQQYIKTNNIKAIQPVISQFISKGKDSTQVKVGFFIDREVKSNGEIDFERMPKTGSTYSAKFYGKFRNRQRFYAGISQYMTDHLYQPALLPFETYFENKLPLSDTSLVYIQVNFGSY